MAGFWSAAVVISPDESIATILDDWLKREGFGVVKALDDVAEALDLLSTDDEYDFLFVDMALPDNTACTVVQLLAQRTNPHLASLPTCIIASHWDEAHVNLMTELGLTTVIHPPLTEKKLQAELGPWLQRHGSETSVEQAVRGVLRSLALKNTSEALERLQAALSLHPKALPLHFLKARALIEAGKVAEAEVILGVLAKAQPMSEAVETLLGKARIVQRRFGEANDCFLRAQRRSPLNVERLVIMGDLALQAGEYGTADEKYHLALRFCSGCTAARRGLVESLLEQGRGKEAIAVSEDPTDLEEVASRFNMRGISLGRQKRNTEALAMYKCALEIVKGTKKAASIRYNIALLLRRDGLLEKAIAMCKSSVSLDAANVKATAFLDRMQKEKVAQLNGTSEPQLEHTPDDGADTVVASERIDLPEERLALLVSGILATSEPYSAEERRHRTRTVISYDSE